MALSGPPNHFFTRDRVISAPDWGTPVKSFSHNDKTRSAD